MMSSATREDGIFTLTRVPPAPQGENALHSVFSRPGVLFHRHRHGVKVRGCGSATSAHDLDAGIKQLCDKGREIRWCGGIMGLAVAYDWRAGVGLKDHRCCSGHVDQ